ncbi:Thyroglobulin type-1 domain and Proteinase inhibitor I2 Kunitz metazoa domain-containing protein [Trichostrongylus colubriformis]|uniref:Thyroglobulin type-1 domain and Proteinase inhibitor I2 Kunitz metazoa domain-containing protein n=1 Tax=Trichostrongylus colubriformis TaxID=6319 RepID=A0AAN8IFJ2_TRICO
MSLLLALCTIIQLCAAELKKETIPHTGPCMLNDDGMKCTKHGYYETVQCDSYGCFCVAANNGLVAFDTRTTNRTTLPKCSNCHNDLKDLYADGDVPQGTFVPKCDVVLGDYEQLQCDARQEYCYCVDTKTGKEVPNTRKRKEGNKYIICGRNNISIAAEQFPITEGLPRFQERYPVAKETCKLDRNRGWACPGEKRSVRYYFDYRTFSCLAFEYLGCGGNENNYPTRSACSSDCKLADLSGCSGMYPPARLSNGQAVLCGAGPQMMLPPGRNDSTLPTAGPKLNEDGCPVDHKCVMGAFFGFCCNRANEDRFQAAYHPTCSNGKEPYSEPIDSWREIRFGKSCKDNFCPSGYKCHDGSIFAYCC